MEKAEFKFKRGSTVKSDITGFEGVNTANSIHMNGCNRCYVQPRIDKDGKIPDGWWIDEPELVLVPDPEIKREKHTIPPPGGFHSSVK